MLLLTRGAELSPPPLSDHNLGDRPRTSRTVYAVRPARWSKIYFDGDTFGQGQINGNRSDCEILQGNARTIKERNLIR